MTMTGARTTLSAIVEGTGMITRRPVAPIQGVLGCYFAITRAPGTTIQTLPDASAYLVIDIPRGAGPRCMLTAPRLKTVRSSPVRKPIDYVGVRLLPGVAFLLTGSAIRPLIGQRLPLARFLGSCATRLAKAVSEADSTDTRFDLLEGFLLERLAREQLDERVYRALRLIEHSSGTLEVPAVAERCGISVRQLERLLLTWVGISPKRLARIARFQAVLGQAEKGLSESGLAGKSSTPQWTNLAAEQHYTDQAHLIHEFSGFTDASPTRFSPLYSPDSLKSKCD